MYVHKCLYLNVDRRLSLDDQDDEGGRPLIETDATSVEDFVNKILREDAKVFYVLLFSHPNLV